MPYQKGRYVLDKSQLVISDTILGKGSFGNVFKGSYYKSQIAVKVLHQTSDSINDFQKEIQILMALKHVNIVGCIGYTMDPVIALEFMPNGR